MYGGRHLLPVKGLVRMYLSRPAARAAWARLLLRTMRTLEGEVGFWPADVLCHDLELGAVFENRVSEIFKSVVVYAVFGG